MNEQISLSLSLSNSLAPVHARIHIHRCCLTFNLIFGQVDRGAVGEDVRDGAHAPVHQRGGYWVHRHDCDLWQPPAPSSYRNVYWEQRNFPPRSPRERSSESMRGRSVWTADSAACSQQKCCLWSATDTEGEIQKNQISYLSDKNTES